MNSDKNWIKECYVQKHLKQNDVENMLNEELEELYEKSEKDFNNYSRKRYGSTHKYIHGQGPYGLSSSKQSYELEHTDERSHVFQNFAVTREEMLRRGKPINFSPFEGRDCRKVKEDPLIEYPFYKFELDYIIERLNNDEGLCLKITGTKNELLNRLKDNIGKGKRKELICNYLDNLHKKMEEELVEELEKKIKSFEK